MTKGLLALLIVALIAIATALAHLSCIYLGPQCYSAQMAPQFVIDSAISGTWIAPIATIAVSLLFVFAGLYALSAANTITRLPCLPVAIYCLSGLCLMRSCLFFLTPIIAPEMFTSSNAIASLVWGVAGSLCFYGYYQLHLKPYTKE